MRRLVGVIVLAAVVGVVWWAWPAPMDEEGEVEAETDVAVRVAPIQSTTLRAYVTAYGTVAPEPAGRNAAASTSVSPSAAGVIVVVNCVEGQKVTKGDVLFELDSRAADVAVDFAQKALAREQQLLQIEGTSAKAVQNAQQELDAARVQQALLRVAAPLSGTVTRVMVKAGQAVDLGSAMAEVVDLGRLVVTAGVPSAELAGLKLGAAAEFTSEQGKSPVTGVLGFIGPRVDPQTGTAEVRVALPGGSKLRPGQFGTLRIASVEHAGVLAVPIQSVVRDEEGMSVIAIVEDDMARRQPVTTGLRDDKWIEVAAEGLQAGMTVVTEGAYGLPETTKVHVIEDQAP